MTVNQEDDGNKYYINGELAPSLNLSSEELYIFDQNDVTASKHPISFSTTKNGIHSDGKSIDNISFYINGYKTTESKYSDNFNDETTFDNGFVVLEPSNTDTELYYYCLFHSGMSNNANILVDGFTPVTTPSIEATLDISNNGASDYTIKSSNNVTYNDPTITLVRGKTYEFDVSSPGHPFWIKTTQSTGSSNALESGITNNGTTNGKITFTVPLDGSDTLYYNCQFHASMTGTINLVENDGVEILTSTNSGSSGGGYGYSFDLQLTYSTDTNNDIGNIIYDSLLI